MQKYHLSLYLISLFILIPNFSFSQELFDSHKIEDSNNLIITNQAGALLNRKLTINDYLISFIDSGNFQFVSYFLVIKKADPNYCNELGVTPLIASVMNPDTNITKLLIKKGADVNFRNINGENALHWAVMTRQVDQLKILIDNKAKVNLKDESGTSPIFYALGYGVYDLLNYANDDYINFSIPDTSGLTTNNLIKQLVDAGADINQVNALDCTPLLFATFQKDASLIKILCNQGANPNKTTQAEVSPLMYAIQDGSYEVIRALIEKGADINYMLTDGNTALFAAVRSNNDSIANLLLKNNARVNIKNDLELTPLHYAAGFGYPFMTQLLISYGANINENDIYGNTPLIGAIYSGAQLVTEILIDSGADVNLADNKGNTPLMIASQFNDTTLINKLFDTGADLNRINNSSINALSIAIENNSVDAFKKLIALGANTDSSQQKKSYYQFSRELGCKEISSFLANKGLITRLKPNISNVFFYTGFSTSQSDFMLDFGGGIHEPITNMLINFGYKYRPHSSRIEMYRNSSFYQFWEKRSSFYLSVQHLLYLKRNFLRGNVGYLPGLSGELSWNDLRGLSKDSGAKWFIVPSIGLFYQKNFYTVIGKWEFANYSKKIIEANRFNLQILLSIPTSKRFINKRIKWLD